MTLTRRSCWEIARTAKADGVELFVLDDGWFSTRCGETSGLGDWWGKPGASAGRDPGPVGKN